MARIRNTAPDVIGTRRLYDEETMGDHYDPPGITFDEQDGTVAQIKKEVVDDVVAKFDHLERVDTEASDADSDSDEDEEGGETFDTTETTES